MAFLIIDDYYDLIQRSVLATILKDEVLTADAVRFKAELKAQQEITKYLNMRYDTAQIFSQVDDNRNPEIVMWMVDISLYNLHSRINASQVPQLRLDRYDMAIKGLSALAKGSLDADLPKPTGTLQDTKNDVQWGGRAPRNPYY